MTHRFGGRAWIVLIASLVLAAHVLVPYVLFRRTLTIAAGSVVLLIVARHVGAALMFWWARRRRT